MTIEITRGKSEYTFRINPFQPCEVDYRKNAHRAMWYRHSVYNTPEEARTALLKLETKEAKP